LPKKHSAGFDLIKISFELTEEGSVATKENSNLVVLVSNLCKNAENWRLLDRGERLSFNF
jgi:hypothetical protein